MPDSSSAGVARLADLTRTLGEPARQLAILGEGNTSLDCGDGTFWIKASGSRMGSVTDADFVRLEAAPLVALSDGPALSESELKAHTLAARVEGAARPSIEAILHALCIQEFGAASAAHCHPVSANSILCSDRSKELAGGILFPDQAVICGAESVFVEYAHPGIDLARAVRTAIARVADRTGEMPRTVWLENHGLLALGSSVDEVLSIVEMADKFARILTGVLAVGEPRWLSRQQAGDLVAREDEIERRIKLASGL